MVCGILTTNDMVTSLRWIVLKAADSLEQFSTAINQLWQTNFTSLKVTGWSWNDLSTVRDDDSRYILFGRLCQIMSSLEVTDALKVVLKVADLSKKQTPNLLSDYGTCYLAGELKD